MAKGLDKILVYGSLWYSLGEISVWLPIKDVIRNGDNLHFISMWHSYYNFAIIGYDFLTSGYFPVIRHMDSEDQLIITEHFPISYLRFVSEHKLISFNNQVFEKTNTVNWIITLHSDQREINCYHQKRQKGGSIS